MTEERYCDCAVIGLDAEGQTILNRGPRDLYDCPVISKMRRLSEPGGREAMDADYLAKIRARAAFLAAPAWQRDADRGAA